MTIIWSFLAILQNQLNKAEWLMELIKISYTYLGKNSFHYFIKYTSETTFGVLCIYLASTSKKGCRVIKNIICHAKLIPWILNLSYVDCLHTIEIPNMKCHWIRGDLIQVYKIFHSEDESQEALFDVGSTSITLGHKFKIKKPFVKNKVH